MKKLLLLAIVGVSLMFSSSAFAHTLVNSGFWEDEFWYLEAGLEVNPVLGPEHPFPFIRDPGPPPAPYPPPSFWDPEWTYMTPYGGAPEPAKFTDYGPGVGVAFDGTSVHIVAPHTGEIAPAVPFDYDIFVPEPAPDEGWGAGGGWGTGGWWGAWETRISRIRLHPVGHQDYYMAVVGVLRGTTPGPLLGLGRVIIGGTIGWHPRFPWVPDPQPIFGGGELVPPSRVPSPDANGEDFPGGELICIVDPDTLRMTMLIIVDSLQGDNISNVFVKDGPNGPTLMDLLPIMQVQHLGEYDTALTVQDAQIPSDVVTAIAAGNAYMTVKFPLSIHPDGKIAGLLSLVPIEGDVNGDGHVDEADLQIVLGAMDSLPPDTNWDHRADLDTDGEISSTDLSIILENM